MTEASRPRASDTAPYHHGDLREALIVASLQLIAEHGVHSFSLAQACRRLGVAPSAPYAHFPSREALLAEIARRGCETFIRLALEIEAPPRDRIAEYVALFVTFAAQQPATFEVLYQAGLDKQRHPYLQQAEREIAQILDRALGELTPCPGDLAELSDAIEATGRGHAAQLLDSHSRDPTATPTAARRAARATRALLTGWSHPHDLP